MGDPYLKVFFVKKQLYFINNTLRIFYIIFERIIKTSIKLKRNTMLGFNPNKSIKKTIMLIQNPSEKVKSLRYFSLS